MQEKRREEKKYHSLKDYLYLLRFEEKPKVTQEITI